MSVITKLLAVAEQTAEFLMWHLGNTFPWDAECLCVPASLGQPHQQRYSWVLAPAPNSLSPASEGIPFLQQPGQGSPRRAVDRKQLTSPRAHPRAMCRKPSECPWTFKLKWGETQQEMSNSPEEHIVPGAKCSLFLLRSLSAGPPGPTPRALCRIYHTCMHFLPPVLFWSSITMSCGARDGLSMLFLLFPFTHAKKEAVEDKFTVYLAAENLQTSVSISFPCSPRWHIGYSAHFWLKATFVRAALCPCSSSNFGSQMCAHIQ